MPRTVVEFEVTGWETADANEHPDGLVLGRAVVRKVFRGDLEATSVADRPRRYRGGRWHRRPRDPSPHGRDRAR